MPIILLSSNAATIDHVITAGQYDDVTMAGLSGGGWATTIHAAINPEIDRSFSFGGTVPLNFKTTFRNTGDYEQYADPLFRQIGYWDLYVLATLDSTGNAARAHAQVYNSNDPCCFRQGTAQAIIDVYQTTAKQPGLSFEIVSSSRHQFHPEIIFEAIERRGRN